MPGSYPDSSSTSNSVANRSPPYNGSDDRPRSSEFWNPSLQYLKPNGGSSSGTATSPPITPVNLLNLEGELPPTPPSISHKQALAQRNGNSIGIGGSIPSRDHLKSGAGGSTPSIQQSPPTPDKTPPAIAMLQTPIRQNLSRTSTRADSFRTAREEPMTPRDDEEMANYSTGRGLSRFVIPPRVRDSSQEDIIAMPHTASTSDVDTLPSASNDQRARRPLKGVSFGVNEPEEPHGAWDSDAMRNVTVRRRRLPRPNQTQDSVQPTSQDPPESPSDAERSTPYQHVSSEQPHSYGETWSIEDTSSGVARSRLPTLHNNSPIGQGNTALLTREANVYPHRQATVPNGQPYISKQRQPVSTLHRSSDRSVSDSVTSRGYGDVSVKINHLRKVSEPHRYSIGSNSAGPIVEAVVIASPHKPPAKLRTLRHVSKNLSLRSSSGSIVSSSSSPAPTSSPVESDRTLRPAVKPERGSIGSVNSHRRASSGSSNLSHGSQPHSLRHRPDRSSLRDETSFKSPLRVSSGPEDMFLNASIPLAEMRRTSQSSSIEQSSKDQNGATERRSSILRRSEVRPKQPTVITSSPKVTFKTASPVEEDDNDLDRIVSRTSRTTSVRSEKIPSLDASQDYRRDSSASRDAQRRIITTSDRRVSNESDKPRISIGSNRRHSTAAEPPDTTSAEFFSRSSIDRTSVSRDEDFPGRRSFDRSSVATYEYGRPSLDRLTIRTEETGLARHMTPFSQLSDLGEGLELSEATAVSIYPHTNNSLLVVQQGARVVHTSGPITLVPGAVHAQNEVPVLTLKPSTPPQRILGDPINVDSPLKNPRRPPEPPAIRIMPATPAEELGSPIEDLLGAGEPRDLTRRPTLTDKARRYSESILQPLLVRTNTMRQSLVGPSRQSRVVSDGAANPSNRSKNNNLHPFWQPKRFWDEDSDEDYPVDDRRTSSNSKDVDYEHDEDPFDDRLPAGGDTTELGEPRGIARIFDSVRNKRNSGAFLLGNTLGLERSGTNKRKPQINLPTNLARTTSGRMVRRVESVGTLRSGFSSVTSASARSQGKGQKGATAPNASSGNAALRRKASRRRMWRVLGLHVEWVGVAGLQERMRERQREKRRDDIRRSIGTRFMVEGGPVSDK